MQFDEQQDGAGHVEAETGVESDQNLMDSLDGSDPTYVSGAPKANNRTMVMIGSLVLAVALGGYFLFFKNGPSSASAASPGSGEASAAIEKFLADENNVKLMTQTLKETEKVVQQFRQSGKAQIPLASLRKNPFRQTAPQADTAPKVDLEKIARAHDDERVRIKREIDGLKLQTIMRGTRKACMINNTLYQEGQTIDGFTIEQIGTTVMVTKRGEYDTYRFELRMQR